MEIKETKFRGHAALKLATDRAEMTVLTGVGPRISEFGPPGGENLLFVDEKGEGFQDWKVYGGHRLWITRPGADECEETYAGDNEPCAVSREDDKVTVAAPVDKAFRTRRALEIGADAEGNFVVDHVVRNESEMLWSGGAWGLTCVNPAGGKTFAVPLGDGSNWDAFKVVIFKRWAAHRTLVNDPQLEWGEDLLVVKPAGIKTKRALQAPRGWIGCYAPAQNCSFFKEVAYDPAASYPLDCNLAFYVDEGNAMVEMETMSPLATLKPGAELRHRETWKLTPPRPWKQGK